MWIFQDSSRRGVPLMENRFNQIDLEDLPSIHGIQNIVSNLNESNISDSVDQIIQFNDQLKQSVSRRSQLRNIWKNLEAEEKMEEFSEEFDDVTKILILEQDHQINEIKNMLNDEIIKMELLKQKYYIDWD